MLEIMELVDKYLKTTIIKLIKNGRKTRTMRREMEDKDVTCTDENITISEINALDGINRLETAEKIRD